MGKNRDCVLTKEEVKKLKKCQKAVLDVISDGNLIEKCLGVGSFHMKNPAVEFVKQAKAGAYDCFSEDEYNDLLEQMDNFGNDKSSISCDYIDMTVSMLHVSSELLCDLSVLLATHRVQKRWDNGYQKISDAHISHDEWVYHGGPNKELLEALEDELISVEDDAE